VEFDEVIGDQGRDDAIETLERLLLDGVPMEGTGGISSWWWLKYPVDDGGLRGMPLIVELRSSWSTFVELFQRCLREFVPREDADKLLSVFSSLKARGEESGV